MRERQKLPPRSNLIWMTFWSTGSWCRSWREPGAEEKIVSHADFADILLTHRQRARKCDSHRSA